MPCIVQTSRPPRPSTAPLQRLCWRPHSLWRSLPPNSLSLAGSSLFLPCSSQSLGLQPSSDAKLSLGSLWRLSPVPGVSASRPPSIRRPPSSFAPAPRPASSPSNTGLLLDGRGFESLGAPFLTFIVLARSGRPAVDRSTERRSGHWLIGLNQPGLLLGVVAFLASALASPCSALGLACLDVL